MMTDSTRLWIFLAAAFLMTANYHQLAQGEKGQTEISTERFYCLSEPDMKSCDVCCSAYQLTGSIGRASAEGTHNLHPPCYCLEPEANGDEDEDEKPAARLETVVKDE